MATDKGRRTDTDGSFRRLSSDTGNGERFDSRPPAPEEQTPLFWIAGNVHARIKLQRRTPKTMDTEIPVKKWLYKEIYTYTYALCDISFGFNTIV